ncbi:MAG: family 10 glycosylhydrolase, partial [Muribaculaceae bacterium]|nr:family 10 glycosylhydrolase [Muribaculaceae bacterium]
MSKKLLIAVVAIILAGGVKLSADDSQKREFRAAWLATVWRIDWPSTAGTSTSVANSQKSQLVAYLDDFQSQNFNAVCFHVRSMCDAMYESSYEPWSSYLTGSRGAKPAWDPLAYAVEQAHARGLELHAWVNPYRWATTSSGWSTAQDQALVNAGLILSYTASDGTVTKILNPGMPESRERIVNVVREIITKYDVDGIIFDDYFYPNGIPTSSSAGDYNLWQAYKSNGGTLSFANWRREQVNQMVRDVYNMIAETKPEVRFGIGPAGVAGTSSTSASKYGVTPCPKGSDWQYNGIFSDPLGWLYDGAIDYISPQLYWKTTHSTNPFGPLTQWWSYCANHFGRHHFASHSISFLASSSGAENNANGWAEVAQQIRLSRQYNLDNAPGVNIYSAKNINGRNGGVSGLGAYLKENVFQTKAIVPAITWKNGATYAAPTNARLSNGKLMWNAVNGTLIKYSVYAVPLSVTIADAQSSTFGGIKSDYLLNLTYTNSFTLPSDKQSGYWYAVCVVDGYDKEYDPAYVN